MADLIDRQTAIETAIEAADKWDGGYSSEREGIIRKFFDKVPAVQPTCKPTCKPMYADVSDTISRQMAIDAVNEYLRLSEVSKTVRDMTCIQDILRRLPSAQPEIIRCKDCDWWTKQEDSVQGRCALMQMYPAGGWYCGNARRRTE